MISILLNKIKIENLKMILREVIPGSSKFSKTRNVSRESSVYQNIKNFSNFIFIGNR